MAGTIKTIGTALLGTFAIPVAGLAGIGAVGALLGLIFSAQNRTSGVFLFFVCSASICFFAIRLLIGFQKKAQRLVVDINHRTGLNLNSADMLGFPSPAFLVFDKQNRKFAMCNSSTGDFQLYELSYLLSWNYEWRNVTNMEISGQGNRIPGTQMHAPAFERVERRQGFTLILEVANEHSPILKFPMSERAAKVWCAKLSAIVNG
ncbi:MAG: hypothetical protein V4695_10800 [Pseudomonadota bacterium]